MGTGCEIQLFAATRAGAKTAARQVIADVERLERRYSRYRHDSFLSQINRIAAQGGEIEVDSETASLLDYAETCYHQSDGLFDITSGLLRRVWRYDRGRVPDGESIRRLLDRIGWSRLQWSAPRLAFPTPGMEIDFGGIVKEYAVDRATSLLKKAGIGHAVINLGGDIRVIGPRGDGAPWRVGLQHPRRRDAALLTLSLTSGAVASSGDYERCLMVDNVRYGHILNPKTGWPVKFLASATVLGDFCVVAGSAATIALLKEESGPQWLQDLGLPHVWVSVAGEVGGSLAGIES